MHISAYLTQLEHSGSIYYMQMTSLYLIPSLEPEVMGGLL